MRVAIVTVQVPFVRGGAEMLANSLLGAIGNHGHQADLVAIPYKHYPPERILDHMMVCRLLDLTESFGSTIDRVIGLKFPAYFVPHPNKVLWLLHQHRSAYDLWDHPQAGDLRQAPNGLMIRDAIHQADRKLIPEAKAVFTLSANVSKRLLDSCAIASKPLYNPPPGAEALYCAEGLDYLLYPSRISPLKRQTLVLKALAHTRQPVRVIFSGAPDHPQFQQECDNLVRQFGLQKRVNFRGAVSETEKVRLYAEATGVIFTPLDEDYGYVTLEAMLSRKAVITCSDSGGPLEFVRHSETGTVAEPVADALAAALDEIWANRERTQKMGLAGYERYNSLDISWNNVVEQLLA